MGKKLLFHTRAKLLSNSVNMGSVAARAVSGQATLATLQQSAGMTNYARQLPSQVKVFQPRHIALVTGRASTSSEFPHPARLTLDSASHGLALVSNSRSFASSTQVQDSLNPRFVALSLSTWSRKIWCNNLSNLGRSVRISTYVPNLSQFGMNLSCLYTVLHK